jgi:hypothetical protein
MNPNARRLRSLALVPFVLGLPALGGCIIIADGSSMRDYDTVRETRSEAYVHTAGTPLRIETGNGQVKVRKGEVTDVQISTEWRMRTQERLEQAKLEVTRGAGNELVIVARPPGGSWRSGEGCSIEIAMPEGVAVDARTSNGQIELSGMSGLAKLRSSNGRIVVNGHDGSVDADSSNGRVELAGVTGSVKAETSNGAVTVQLDRAGAGPVDVRTSNGSIAFTAGAGFEGTVTARTSNGSISLPSASSRLRTASVSRSNAEFSIGNGTQASTLRTSNGSITVNVTQ